jgi:hypothetical protein
MELDEFRSAAILRQLDRFTLVSCEVGLFPLAMPRIRFDPRQQPPQSLNPEKALRTENMLKKPGDAESSPPINDDIGTTWDEEWERIIGDFETDIVVPASSVHEESPYLDSSEFTHLLIPRAGHAIANTPARKSDDCCVENDRKTKWSFLLLRKFTRTSKVGPDNRNARKERTGVGPSCTIDEADTVNDPVTESREVPIYCAVCLTKYNVPNRVSWSSNSECSHVFHEDCMLRWLVELGRNGSSGKRFTKSPSEGKLLEFHMSCPCCRLDFISRDAILGTEENT